MNSLEALNNIENYHNEEVYDIGGTYVENIFEKEIKTIRDDLENFEKYEKIINILRWCPDVIKQLKQKCDDTEIELIEEVLENDRF